MRVVHWVEKGLRSGLGHTATHISQAERALGLDSILVDCNDEKDWPNADGADVYVVHLFLPLKRIYDKTPKVWVAHGTPDLMFESAYLDSTKGQYGPADGWMLAQYWLQHADVTVTFWPRHEAIWKSLSDKNTRIEGVPMGADLEFWKPAQSGGKFAGEPSVFSAENCYTLKWPWDMLIAWPWVARELPEAKLHATYVPMDQSRFWGSLINRNGAGFHTYMTHRAFSHEELRNAFNSTDFYCGLVRYGDHNYIGLQANASGSKTISYSGNPYSDFWVNYGDQRVLAQQLGAILRGEVEPRMKSPVISMQRTVERMKEIYLSLAKDAPTGLPQPKQRKKKVITPETSLATMTLQ